MHPGKTRLAHPDGALVSTLRRLLLALALLGVCCADASGTATEPPFSLSSPDFQPNGRLPETFVLNIAGCTGGNISPALAWQNAPKQTQSFALTLFDPDEHGTPSGWWHWVVYDLPRGTTHLPAAQGSLRARFFRRAPYRVEAISVPRPTMARAPSRAILRIDMSSRSTP